MRDEVMNTEQVIALYVGLFGVHRRTVTERWMREPDFPKPALAVTRTAKAWRRSDIESWRRSTAS